MIRLLLLSILLSIAFMREKPPYDFYTETDYPTAELFASENEFFFVFDKKVKAIVEGPYVEIQSIYTCKSSMDHLVEAQFDFPQSEGDISHKIQIRHENQDIVRTIFDEVNSPKKEYDRKNLYTGERFTYRQIPAGNIRANETVEIILTVMRPLKVQLNQFYELSIRPYHSPRFKPFFQAFDPRNYSVQVELRSERPFALLANPTHHLQPEILNHTDSLSGITTYKAFYKTTMHIRDFMYDFKIYFASSDFNAPQTLMATHPFNPHDHAFMFSLIPDMNYFPSRIWRSPSKKNNPQVLQNLDDPTSFLKLKKLTARSDLHYFPSEYLFVIDRSNSTEETHFKELKETLTQFLEILSKSDSYYSILSFGDSSHLHLKRPDSDNPLEEAEDITKWVENLQASLGQRDLLSALKYVFEEHEWTSLPKNVIVLTGGEVPDLDEIIELVQANSHSQRVCGMGFDRDGKDTQKITEAGRCPAEFLSPWSHSVEERALNLMNATIEPPGFNLAYKITCENEQEQVVHQEEDSFDGIPNDKAFTKWVTLSNIPHLKSCKAYIFYYSASRCFSFSEEIEIFSSSAAEITDIWHKVADHAKLYDELPSKESKRNLMVNNIQDEQLVALESQETIHEEFTSQDQSPYSVYDIYQEQFDNLHCRDRKAPLLNSGFHSLNFQTMHQEREEESVFSFLSFKIICIASAFTMLFVAGLYILF